MKRLEIAARQRAKPTPQRIARSRDAARRREITERAAGLARLAVETEMTASELAVLVRAEVEGCRMEDLAALCPGGDWLVAFEDVGFDGRRWVERHADRAAAEAAAAARPGCDALVWYRPPGDEEAAA